jgi:hypothetical protein
VDRIVIEEKIRSISGISDLDVGCWPTEVLMDIINADQRICNADSSYIWSDDDAVAMNDSMAQPLVGLATPKKHLTIGERICLAKR